MTRPKSKIVFKPDEAALWEAIQHGESPRDAAVRLGIPEKRKMYICEKWATKGIYDYGVCADLGWAVPEERN